MKRTVKCPLVAAIVLLAGCGGGGNSPAPTPAGPPSVGSQLNESSCFYQYTLTSNTLLSGADPRFGEQWHLTNTGQSGGTAGEDLDVAPVWQQALGTTTNKGNGVRVAVIDDSVEVTHEDLVANVAAGESYNYRPAKRGNTYPLPCFEDDSHGTAVAGIVAARDGNAVGVAGVAPRSTLVAYNALATGEDADVADALTRALSANQIYHNSWGSPDNGRLNAAEQTFVNAIENGIVNGRQGKGAVYVFSAGNGGCYVLDTNSNCQSDDNSNFDGYVNKKGVIAACAVDDRGRAPSYTEPGANILICGPSGGSSSGITTTFPRNTYRPGPGGNPSAFSGTSASAPMVSGVVALMLAANPALTWRDVRLVLARSARQNDAADTGWVSHVGDNVTYHFNHKYGFGVADAQSAVALAKTWTSVGGSSSLVACERAEWSRTVNQVLPDAPVSGAPTTVADSLAVAGGDCAIRKLEFVEVKLTTTHSYSGDLRVRLVSPNGLASDLAVERQCPGDGDACGAFGGWAFGSVRHMDESPVGNWRLEVTDAVAVDTGTWNSWSIRFWGRP